MSFVMNAQRFAALAGAYGGDVRRWPEAERGEALAFLEMEPAKAQPVLEAARAIDGLLDSAPHPYPSQALRERVLASAPRSGERPARRWLSLWAPEWLAPGAGLAAAFVAGAWLGLIASHNAVAQFRADTVLVASADQTAGDQDGAGGL